jgi:hypothetical protein
LPRTGFTHKTGATIRSGGGGATGSLISVSTRHILPIDARTACDLLHG